MYWSLYIMGIMFVTETLTNQSWGRSVQQHRACCEGSINPSSKARKRKKSNQMFTRGTCLCKRLVRSCNSSSFKRNTNQFNTLHFYEPEWNLWGKKNTSSHVIIIQRNSCWQLGVVFGSFQWGCYIKCPCVLTSIARLQHHCSDCALLAASSETQGWEKGVNLKPNVLGALLLQ